ncbi:DNA primase, partial [Nocardiopsis umidischolae]|nr:DNA primase [Nocardiopsis umidischolae]
TAAGLFMAGFSVSPAFAVTGDETTPDVAPAVTEATVESPVLPAPAHGLLTRADAVPPPAGTR